VTYTVCPERTATTAHARVLVGANAGASNHVGSVLAVPASQLYYWTRAWQVNEQAAAAELARGEGREFDNADDAIRWLLAAED
jgi:hypothetical protein